MPGKMASSAAHPPFRAVHVTAAGPRHPPALPERQKSAKIRTGSAVHMRNPGLDKHRHKKNLKRPTARGLGSS